MSRSGWLSLSLLMTVIGCQRETEHIFDDRGVGLESSYTIKAGGRLDLTWDMQYGKILNQSSSSKWRRSGILSGSLAPSRVSKAGLKMGAVGLR